MAARRQEFVTFYYPGILFSETASRPIGDRDPKAALALAEAIKAKPYGFCFETRIVIDPVSDGEGGTVAVPSKLVDQSGTYFIGGKLETLDDVIARNDPKERILQSNMRNDDWHIVCVTMNGHKSTMPFTD